jgi:hypothetical protein
VSEKPILFNTEMVKAILDGRKTMTRRVIKPQPVLVQHQDEGFHFEWNGYQVDFVHDIIDIEIHAPIKVGDKLYVREAYYLCSVGDDYCKVIYPSDDVHRCIDLNEQEEKDALRIIRADNDNYRTGCHPSIHMPKWAARLWLEVTAVKVERLQDITALDCVYEGINLPEVPNAVYPLPTPGGFDKWSKKRQDEWFMGAARTMYFAQCLDIENHFSDFKILWDSINSKRGLGWQTNPWVWVYTFKVIK